MNIKKTWMFTLIMLCCVFVLFPMRAWALETEEFEYTIKDNKATITKYIGKTGKDVDVIVPDTLNGCPVTVLGGFEGKTFHRITLPDTIIEIQNSAFYSVTAQEIIMPNNLQTIGQYAFWFAHIPYVNIPDSVTSIGSYVFFQSEITSCQMSSGIKEIPKNTFTESKLESIILKEGLESISEYAFEGCKKLKSLQIPSTVTKIQHDAFLDCYSLESVNVPYGVTTIEGATFANCKSLKEIIIPNSVTKIENNFWNYGAFEGCESLTSLVIPNSVTEIGYHAFDRCNSLVSLIIPNSVKKLGDIINDCKNLESVIIPSSVVEGSLFSGRDCPKMIVYVKSGSYAEKKAKEKSELSVVVDDSVDSIAASVQQPSTTTSNIIVSNPVWKQNEFGWWLENPNGSYLTNTWYQSPDSGLWYYIGADGYMLTNTVTPDGFQVGMDGVWIH